MSKHNAPPAYGPPPAAPPSYSQAVGGVPPSSPFTPGQSRKKTWPNRKFNLCDYFSVLNKNYISHIKKLSITAI